MTQKMEVPGFSQKLIDSGLICKGTQYNKSDQFFFYVNSTNCTYIFHCSCSLFVVVYRRLHLAILATRQSPPHRPTQWRHCRLTWKLCAKQVFFQQWEQKRSQPHRVLDLANMVDGVMIRSHIQLQQTWQHHSRGVAKGGGVLGPPHAIPQKIIKDKTCTH